MEDLLPRWQGSLDGCVPLQRRRAGTRVPLTATQRGFRRYIERMGGRSLGNVTNAVRIKGPLDTQLLQDCLQMLIDRHEALRTRIVVVDDVPHQVIDARGSIDLQHVDLSRVAADLVQTDLRRAAEEFARQESEPARGPLFRAALLTASPDDHVLVMSVDHMVCDAISAAILKRELWQCYGQRANADAPDMSPLAVQFPDYAIWQQHTYDAWRARHESYWLQRVSGLQQVLLPVDCVGEQPISRTSASQYVPMGKRLSDALRDVARREGVPLPVVVLTVYACAMATWCERRDLLIALATHGRHVHPQLRDMVGCLAGGLHLRIDLGNGSPLDVLRRAHREFLAAFDHYDFDRLIELVPGSGTELSFNWLSSERLRGSGSPSEQVGALRLRPFALNFAWLGKLFAFFTDGPSGISVGVTYRPDLFLPATVQRFGECLQHAARALVGCRGTASATSGHA